MGYREIALDYYGGSAVIPIDGLVAEYLYSGNTLDTSGNNYNLTNSGCVLTTDKNGNIDSAYYFDGVNDNQIYSGKIIDITNFAISLWVNPSLLERYPRILDFGDGVNNFQLLFDDTSNGGSGAISTKNTTYQPISNYSSTGHNIPNSVFYNGYWKHIVINGTQTSTEVYVNGSMLNNVTSSIVGAINVLPTFIIGIRRDGLGSTNYKGKIDDIRVYDHLLTTDEITQLYNE